MEREGLYSLCFYLENVSKLSLYFVILFITKKPIATKNIQNVI